MDHACCMALPFPSLLLSVGLFFLFVLLSPSNHLIPRLLCGDIQVHGVSPSPTAIIHLMAMSS